MSKPSYTQLTLEQQRTYGNGCGLSARWLNVPEFIFTASCRHHDFNYERGTGFTPPAWFYGGGVYKPFRWLPWPLFKAVGYVVDAVEYVYKGVRYKWKADKDFYTHMLSDALASRSPIKYSILSTVYFIGVLINPVAWWVFSYGRWRTIEEILERDQISKL